MNSLKRVAVAFAVIAAAAWGMVAYSLAEPAPQPPQGVPEGAGPAQAGPGAAPGRGLAHWSETIEPPARGSPRLSQTPPAGGGAAVNSE
ncbi:MAG TPA: hypothetical protein VKQ73_11970 [Stellaceae bacterium]|nr:hypothetical protein [Stellaceae bacterium]